MIGSPEINKVIRKVLSPSLKQHGFTKVMTRKNWGWHEHSVWSLEIRAVGSYFSAVTGWTPSSIGVHLGVFYDFIPFSEELIKTDGGYKLLPSEVQCHFRTSLNHAFDQTSSTAHLRNPAERNRNDLWWIASDGSNVEEALQSIEKTIVERAVPWFEYFSDPKNAYSYVLTYHDCPAKYYLAKQFAQFLNDEPNFKLFSALLEEKPISENGIPQVGIFTDGFWSKQIH